MSRLFFPPQAVRVNSAGTPYASAEANFYLTTTTTRTNSYTDNARAVAHANPVVADSAGQFAAIYLDPAITYRCIITEASAGTQIDDIDPVHAPIISSDITSADAGGYYAGTDVEAQLQDVGNTYAKKSAANTFTADITLSSADLKCADNIVERAEIKDYSLTHTTISSSSGTLTIDLSTGNSFQTVLTENITDVVISNPSPTAKQCSFTLRVIQDGAAGAYTVATQASETVKYPGGTPPVISTGNDAIDVITFWTDDTGTTWYANFAQAYAV